MDPFARVALHQIPKPGGGDRVLTVLDPAGEAAYRDAVAAAAPISGYARGAILDPMAPATLAVARGRWRAALHRAITPGACFVVSDVADCYPAITPAAVVAGCRAAGAPWASIERVLAVLSRIRAAGAGGLPVGPAPSALLADVVLGIADRAAAQAGATVVRWVDDVAIVAPGVGRARRAFDAWAAALRGLGLEPHEGKTRTLTDHVEAWAQVTGLRPSDPSWVRRGMMRAP